MLTCSTSPAATRSVSCRPGALRPVLHRAPFRASAKASATSVSLTDNEREALKTYKGSGGVGKDACLRTLQQAAATKAVPPPTVEGALLALEECAYANPTGAPTPDVAGRWRLLFGTGTKIRQFQYIPVKEDFVLNTNTKELALESSIGPFSFFIRGKMAAWKPETGELDFQFTQVDIEFLGKQFWQVTPKTKPKTYTFFYVSDKLAAARSSAGGMALLVKDYKD